jgi:hypothetical protein
MPDYPDRQVFLQPTCLWLSPWPPSTTLRAVPIHIIAKLDSLSEHTA